MAKKKIIQLPFTPRVEQMQAYESRKRFNVLVCHRRWGKTVYEINKLVRGALEAVNASTGKPCGDWRGAYLAPLYKQAKMVAWDMMKTYTAVIPGVGYNESELRVDFPNGSRVRLLGAENPDALRGIYLDGCVLDEVAQMDRSVWGEVIRPALSDRLGWADFIGTPKGINFFYERYQHALKSDDWYGALWTVYDTGIVGEAELKAAQDDDMTESQFKQEFLCDFQASSDDTLIPLELIVAAKGKHIPPSAYNFAPKIMGIDVGRDHDPSVIARRQGLAGFNSKKFHISDHIKLAEIIAANIREWEPDAVFIDQGWGVGVIAMLRRLGFSDIVHEVPFGSSPADPHYLNKRAEMYGGVKKWLKEGGALPDNNELVADLSAQRLKENQHGKIQLVEKKEIRAELGRSTDDGDSFALTFAHPVRSKWEREARAVNLPHKKKKYDVHGRFRRLQS